jgi:hypothetical protein
LTRIWKVDPRLYYAAKWRFGSWPGAIRAAGLVPKPRLTQDDVIAALRLRHRQGVLMTTVWKDNIALYGNAKRLFGSWRSAMRAAGLECKSPRRWTKEDVLEAIRDRQRRGLPLVHVWKTDIPLSRAAKQYFGHWYEALAASGVDRPCRTWNRAKVLAALQACHRDGVPLSQVWKIDKGLFHAGRRYFGSWPNALEAAGVPCRRRRQWSKEAVLQELRDWHRGKVRRPGALAHAAKQRFGSTRKAWEAAGLDPPYHKWTRRRVIEAIQDGYVRRMTAHIAGYRDKSLAAAAKRLFGSWADALVAAGLPRELGQPKTRHWNATQVIETIRAWHQSGRRLANVHREDRSLYAAAATYLGTWRHAVQAAGLCVSRQQWTPQKVIHRLKTRRRQGLSIRGTWKEDRFLYAAGIRHFGGWHKALMAAGIDAESAGPGRRQCVSGAKKRPTTRRLKS